MNLTASPDFPLLFQWEPPRVQRGPIIFFLILSLLGHAFCFYLFQIVYPPPIALLPPPARVSLIAADSPEGQTLLHWIEAEDPALAFTTVRPTEVKLRALPQIEHAPSYQTHQPMLREPPPLNVDLREPSAEIPGPVRIAPRVAGPESSQQISTTISFSREFTSLGKAVMPPLKFTASTNEAPQNMRFRVGIGPGGDVQYCFPLKSSGDSALDEQARQTIALCRFPGAGKQQRPTFEELVWGIVTLDWGNDVAPPVTTSTKSTAP
jgi:hypothetical protein